MASCIAASAVPSRSRVSRAPSRRDGVTFAGHPSRSKKAEARTAPKRAKLPVLEKLAMWGIDTERMRTGKRDPNRPTAGRTIEVKEQRAPVVEDDEPSTTASTVPAASVADDEPAAPPPTKTQSARVVELLARQEEEHWPAQGSDEWLLARTRIISASEASTALGIYNFRTPERLIRDKLARLDKFESVSEAILAASRDETRASYLAAVQAEKDLGWRAKGKGGKGGKKKAKRRKNSVGGKRFAGSTQSKTSEKGSGPRQMPPPVVHGNTYEPVARDHYAAKEGQIVHEFGLKIHDDVPWLGATPDGITDDGKVLEIKCPYSRPVLPNVRCKEHYPQLQVLMQVYGLDSCDFVQFKPAGVGMGHAGVMNEDRPLYLRETVARDDNWWRVNQPRLLAFQRQLETALAERDERIQRLSNAYESGELAVDEA